MDNSINKKLEELEMRLKKAERLERDAFSLVGAGRERLAETWCDQAADLREEVWRAVAQLCG